VALLCESPRKSITNFISRSDALENELDTAINGGKITGWNVNIAWNVIITSARQCSWGFDFQFAFDAYINVQIVCLTRKSLTLNRRPFLCSIYAFEKHLHAVDKMSLLRNNGGSSQFVTFSSNFVFPWFHHRQILMLLANCTKQLTNNRKKPRVNQVACEQTKRQF
jgi:hypothetical protein